MTETELGLVLIHPAVTTTPEMVVQIVGEAASKGINLKDQYQINKLNDGSVSLSQDAYDVGY